MNTSVGNQWYSTQSPEIVQWTLRKRYWLFRSLTHSTSIHISFFFSPFIFISWRLITLQYCRGFCHTLTWISHGFAYIPHPDPSGSSQCTHFYGVLVLLHSIPLEAENTESLSHTYFWGKSPLEVIVKSWRTSSVEDWESSSSRDDMGCTGRSSSCSTEIDDPLYLRRLSQGVSRGS